MQENSENPELIQSPAPASADVVRDQVQRGEFTNAYQYCQKINLPETEWEDLSKNVDNAALPENNNPKQPLTPEEFEALEKEDLYKQIDEFGTEHNPEMRFVNRSEEAVSESQELIDELLELIQKAKNQIGDSRGAHQWSVTAFPVIGSIYGLIKSRRFKTNLQKIEKLHGLVNNGQLNLPPTLKADVISPAKGQGKQIGGTAAAIGGGLLLGPLGTLPGLITTLYGKFQSFESFEKSGKRYEDLVKLENELIDLKNQNSDAENICSEAQTEYREGAIENLKSLSAA